MTAQLPKRRALGRGLDALIPGPPPAAAAENDEAPKIQKPVVAPAAVVAPAVVAPLGMLASPIQSGQPALRFAARASSRSAGDAKGLAFSISLRRRSFISPAAFSVKVTAAIRSSVPPERTSPTIRARTSREKVRQNPQ